jgi:hypothetical protein
MTGMPLPDSEVKRLGDLPRTEKAAVYGPIESWFGNHKDWLTSRYPGKTFMVDVVRNHVAFGGNFEQAYKNLCLKHGPTPSAGRPLFVVKL